MKFEMTKLPVKELALLSKQNLPFEATGLSLIELPKLEQKLKSGLMPEILEAPISANQFQMLEAELVNQGLLRISSDLSTLISQQAAKDTSLWRWRILRINPKIENTQILIDVPRFILDKAKQILEIEKRKREGHFLKHISTKEDFQSAPIFSRTQLSNIYYLESFAAFINGAFEEVQSKYEKGLNVVLKALCKDTQVTGSCSIVLPTTLKEVTNYFSTLIDDR